MGSFDLFAADYFLRNLQVALRRAETMKMRYVVTNLFVT